MTNLTALMSVYNGEEFVGETIESVLNQSYRDFEFIIIDDGSIDRTLEIIKSYDDSRIKVYHFNTNYGIPTALNFGINHSLGEYIVKVDADDLQHPQRFEKQLNYMKKNPKFVLTKTVFKYFSSDEDLNNTNNIIEFYKNVTKESEDISTRLKWHCCIAHSTMMIKTEVLKKYGYRELPLFEDYDLFYRMNEDGLLMGHLDEELVRVRISNNSTTQIRKELFDKCAYIVKEKKLTQFKNNESIFIWGGGEFGRSVLKVILQHGWSIKGFIDSDINKIKSTISSYTVFSPEIIDTKKYHKIIVASQPGMYDIIQYLEKKGYETDKDFIVFR